MADNAYQINGPLCVSFSGGRSSAYMLYKILEAHGGSLPKDVVVVFANTGKEVAQTLDFVNACSINWGVMIIWVELESAQITKQGKRNSYKHTTKTVTYETASRNGEPFKNLVDCRPYLPNAVARYCTAELKIRRINDYMKSLGLGVYETAVGIRGDEERRATNIIKQKGMIAPLYRDQVTKHDVGLFWRNQPFDLALENNDGVTPMGNCDLCFLKSKQKKIDIIRANPSLVKWWSDIEQEKNTTFRQGQSYSDLLGFSQNGITDNDYDEILDCFCAD